MNIDNLSDLEQLKTDINNIIKAVKLVDKRSTRYQSMSLESTTDKQRARASDVLNLACAHLYELEDNIHATLVDLDLTPLLDADHYYSRELTSSAGLGHSIKTLYKPKLPKIIKDNNNEQT